MKTTREGRMATLGGINGQVFELARRQKQTDFLIAKSLEAFVKEVPFHKKTDPLHSWQHVEDLIARALRMESQRKK